LEDLWSLAWLDGAFGPEMPHLCALQNPMKMHLPIVALLFLGLTACGNGTEADQVNDAPAPAAAEAEAEKGTQVRIGGDGVNVQTDKVDINISSDSGTVRIGD